MPWYLDEAYQETEVTWEVEAGQDLPENLRDPLYVHDATSGPVKVRLASDIDFVPDFGKGFVLRTFFVSSRFKGMVENFEPGRHHFWPLDVVNIADCARPESFYLFKVGNITRDALIAEELDIKAKYRDGQLLRYAKTKLHSRLMWDADAVGAFQVWNDMYLPGCVIVSDAVHAAMKEQGMCDHGMFCATESRMR